MRGRGSNTFGSVTVNGVKVGNKHPASNPFTPPIPQPAANIDNLAACVTALKAGVESLIGQRGDASNRAVTFNDLVDFGLLSPGAVASPNGSADFGSGGGGGTTIITGGASVTVADVAPSGGAQGDLWFDSVGAQLYLNYADPNSTQWVIANSGIPGPPATGGGGGGGIPEAPLDGSAYGRQSASWTQVLMSANDIVDGGNF